PEPDRLPTARHRAGSRSTAIPAAPIRRAFSPASSAPAFLRGAACVADAAEFVAGKPVGPGAVFAHRPREAIVEREILHHAAPVPGGIVFVARQVVGVLAIGDLVGAPGRGSAVEQVLPAVD